MKQNYIKWIYLLTAAAGLQLAACTGSDEMTEWFGATQSSNADSRTTEPTTANVTLTETGTLDTKLTEKLGEKKLLVQELTLAGPFNAKDVETLHTLTKLEKLDLTNLMIKTEGSTYSFNYFYEENGSTYERNVTEWLPENAIGNYMFAGMPSLKEITMPVSVQAWGSMIFQHTGLTTGTAPEGATAISGFQYCTTLKTVNLPSTLTEIGNEAFRSCTALKDLTIPKNVKRIGPWAFAGSLLSSIKLPDMLTAIESYAFESCQLKEINIPASVKTLGYGIFENCDQLKTLTVPETVTQIDGSLINNCDNLQALIWNSEMDIEDISGVNGNCYLYLQDKNGCLPAWGPNWENIIIDGVAEHIELKSYDYSQNGYGCPQTFKAKKVTYSINFNGYLTNLGESSAWNTLVLPFSPTTIRHAAKGALAPFGSGIEGTKPFWLRSLTTAGFADATTIEPNKPYIIAMPYNPSVYMDEYNISGTVTFEGTNVEFEATSDELPPAEGPDYYLHPTYKYMAGDGNIYILNKDSWVAERNIGSTFVNTPDWNVLCFEAYITPKPGTRTRTEYSIDTRSVNTRNAAQKNTSGIPAIGDM